MLQISSTIRLSKNLLSLIDEFESDEVAGGSGGDCEDGTVETLLRSNNSNGAIGYLTPNARQAFTQLKQAFIKALIFWHFDPKCHIRIKIDASGYAIGGVLSQFTDSGQWTAVAYYSWKMIPAKTWYKTHNDKLLAIVKAFKIWQHYLESCKHEVFVLTNHNNLCRFIEIKSLSSC